MDEALRNLYQEVILDHGRHPRNYRQPADFSNQARGYNPICGDNITIYLTLDADGEITDAAFQGRGCAIAQASASMMTEMLPGRTVAEVERLAGLLKDLCRGETSDADQTDTRDAEALQRLQVLSGVREFPTRVKCATLAWHAAQAALSGQDRATTE